MSIRFAGFADEASTSLEEQISTLKEVGWGGVELRLVNGSSVCDQTADEWTATLSALRDQAIDVAGFGGQIANWSRPIDGDFQDDMDELRRCAPRMRESGTQLIRIMSYPNSEANPLSRTEWRLEVVRRIGELARVAEDEGVILGHENCSGYGGIGPDEYNELADAVDSSSFKLIFDTGNNSLHDNDPETTWRFYQGCREHIIHIHIKAAKLGPEGTYVPCYPDEDPIQERILYDLAKTGYQGWISVEPHMAAAIHEGKDASGAEAKTIWLEYARRTEAMVKKTFGGVK